MFENEFKGKVVLVTGGSRGIGFAAVKGFLAGGAKVYFLSHYEETGAKALAALVEPDVCLVLEGPPADDFPDAGAIVQGRLGGGPQIRMYDPSMIANRALARLAVAQAQKLGIPYQVTVRESGGTDGSAIQVQTAGGVPTLVIGIPVRYAHSHQSIINLKDLEATVRLVTALLGVLDEPTVADLKRHPW